MFHDTFPLRAIGVVRSALTELESAPLQCDEGGPEAWLELSSAVAPALAGVRWATSSVRDVDGSRLRVAPLEALDGTAIVDLKPVLLDLDER
jgi:tRNA (Thr-GGU) A37 N-methylase